MKAKTKAPPKTRNLEKTRATILQVAFLEIFRHGFQGVSIDDIVAKTKLTKGALYHQFPTKMDLGYALVEEVIEPMVLDRWIKPLENYQNPVEGILALLDLHIGQVDPQHLKLGCPLNNLVQEMAPIDRGFKTRLKNALDLWINGIEEHLKRGVRNGSLKKSTNTKDLARFIVMAHEGFYGMIKGLDEPTLFKSLLASLKSHLEAQAA